LIESFEQFPFYEVWFSFSKILQKKFLFYEEWFSFSKISQKKFLFYEEWNEVDFIFFLKSSLEKPSWIQNFWILEPLIDFIFTLKLNIKSMSGSKILKFWIRDAFSKNFKKKYSNLSNPVIWIHVSNVVKSFYAKDIRINSPHLKHVFI
jgi:hypothetical protein